MKHYNDNVQLASGTILTVLYNRNMQLHFNCHKY